MSSFFNFFLIVYYAARNLNKSLCTSLIISLGEIAINGIALSKSMDVLKTLIHINNLPFRMVVTIHTPCRVKKFPFL